MYTAIPSILKWTDLFAYTQELLVHHRARANKNSSYTFTKRYQKSRKLNKYGIIEFLVILLKLQRTYFIEILVTLILF